jgi:cephalosporin hydroxylase
VVDADVPQPVMDHWELEMIQPYVVALSPRKVYLEIGSRDGGSLIHFCRLMEPGAIAVSVDLPGTKPSLHRAAELLISEGYKVKLIAGDSRTGRIRSLVSDALAAREADLLLIDADHSLSGAALDAHNYVRHVRKTGLVMLHDCGPCVADHPSAYTRRQIRIHAVWRDLGGGRRSLLVQERSGLGLVWM